MRHELQQMLLSNLPAMSGCQVTYNAAKNVFLSMGYTSAAGNTYFKAVRLSDRLIVAYNIGEGYAHTFLNGILLFAWNGKKANLIAEKKWGGSNYRFFNEQGAKQESIAMLSNYLEGQAKLMGTRVSRQELLDFSRSMIDETQQKRIA